MKKAIIAVVVVVVAMFVIGTDPFVNPFVGWIEKNKQGSSSPRLMYSMAGYLYMVAQRQTKAVELYQKAFNWFPGYKDESEAHYRVGLYHESQKDYPKATAEYQLIIQKWPNMADKLALPNRIARFKAYSGDAGNP